MLVYMMVFSVSFSMNRSVSVFKGNVLSINVSRSLFYVPKFKQIAWDAIAKNAHHKHPDVNV